MPYCAEMSFDLLTPASAQTFASPRERRISDVLDLVEEDRLDGGDCRKDPLGVARGERREHVSGPKRPTRVHGSARRPQREDFRQTAKAGTDLACPAGAPGSVGRKQLIALVMARTPFCCACATRRGPTCVSITLLKNASVSRARVRVAEQGVRQVLRHGKRPRLSAELAVCHQDPLNLAIAWSVK